MSSASRSTRFVERSYSTSSFDAQMSARDDRLPFRFATRSVRWTACDGAGRDGTAAAVLSFGVVSCNAFVDELLLPSLVASAVVEWLEESWSSFFVAATEVSRLLDSGCFGGGMFCDGC